MTVDVNCYSVFTMDGNKPKYNYNHLKNFLRAAEAISTELAGGKKVSLSPEDETLVSALKEASVLVNKQMEFFLKRGKNLRRTHSDEELSQNKTAVASRNAMRRLRERRRQEMGILT